MVPLLLTSWRFLQHPEPGTMEIHLMPMGDTRQHAFDTACVCGVYEDDPGFFIHCAFDGREAYEVGKRKPH